VHNVEVLLPWRSIMGKEQNQKKETKKKPSKTMKEKKVAKAEKKGNK
jgi:hypothetical protein